MGKSSSCKITAIPFNIPMDTIALTFTFFTFPLSFCDPSASRRKAQQLNRLQKIENPQAIALEGD
jgi:hypothetical protein